MSTALLILSALLASIAWAVIVALIEVPK